MTLYFFSHFVRAWMLPPGLNILLASVGISLALTKKYVYVGRAFSLFALISLYLFSIPVVSQLFFYPLQTQYPPLQRVLFSQKNSAIVVLGGGSTPSSEYGTKETLNAETVDRLRYAVFLYQQMHIPIIVSGGGNMQGDTEALLMKNVLLNSFHIPIQQIWMEDKSINTADEAKFLLPILRMHRVQTLYLVTNAWHMPRSVTIFNFFLRGLNVKIIPAPMGYMEFSLKRTGLLDYVPFAQTLKQTSTAIEEYIGLFWYKIYYIK